MKRFIEGRDRNQQILLPEQLDDYVTDCNPVRVVDVFVDELDLVHMGSPSCRRQRADLVITPQCCSRYTSTVISIDCSQAGVWSARRSETLN